MGRPTDLTKSKNRVHAIVLNEKAEIILRKVIQMRGDAKWLHRYMSEHIIRDFENGSNAFLLHLLVEKQKERKKLDEEINNIAIKYQKIKEQEELLKIGR